MANCTEKLPLKLTFDDHAGLAMIAHARGTDMHTVAREFIHDGIQKVRQEYTLAARMLRSEEIAGNSRGSGK
jgi:hypothetical protein